MNSAPQDKGGIWSNVLLLLFWLPAVSFLILLAQAKSPQQTVPTGPPAVVAVPTTTPETANQVTSNQQTVPSQITAVQPTSSPPPTALPAQENPPDTNAEFLALYGEHLYPTLQSMPADMLTWYLTWIHRVAVHYDVPEEDILAVHYAELMGGGFNPLESRRSSADAAGPGQIIPETWNGWSCGSNQAAFMTDPQEISRCGGLGTDFDGDGIANVDSLPDNLAATALHIKFDGVVSSLRSNAGQHEAILRDALAQYNSNKSYWQAPQITRTYVDIGLAWWRENSALIPVYLSVYAPNA